ncbi:hypothetical protein EPUL_001547 [Erysiphe pulchra]|uniref:Uncharacterized protein n=1 Tax=Erysiphe pulchra TaxID=225359 RepID=A0A2S4PY96_9PEZI|nr:hypothetical protein EPUL_001547 [Erysiphe pulchra]
MPTNISTESLLSNSSLCNTAPGTVYKSTRNLPDSAYANLKALFNGPIVCGVGASVDAGLARDQFHALPWNIDRKVAVKITENASHERLDIQTSEDIAWKKMTAVNILRIARYNVEVVFKFKESIVDKYQLENAVANQLYQDALSILVILTALNYYGDECRTMTDDEERNALQFELTDTQKEIYKKSFFTERGCTFIIARIYTNYQTNHAIGGNPIQASMASAVNSYYNVSHASARSVSDKNKLEAITKVIYWATHPVDEAPALLIPARQIKSLCADLGYAVRKLLPKTGVGKSSIMSREYQLNIAWKTTIDSIRLELQEAQGKMAGSEAMKMIMKRIAPFVISESWMNQEKDGAPDIGPAGSDDDDSDSGDDGSGGGNAPEMEYHDDAKAEAAMDLSEDAVMV